MKISIGRTLQKALNMVVQAFFSKPMFSTVRNHSLHTYVFANFSDYRGSSNSTDSISRCFTKVLLKIHTQFHYSSTKSVLKQYGFLNSNYSIVPIKLAGCIIKQAGYKIEVSSLLVFM